MNELLQMLTSDLSEAKPSIREVRRLEKQMHEAALESKVLRGVRAPVDRCTAEDASLTVRTEQATRKSEPLATRICGL